MKTQDKNTRQEFISPNSGAALALDPGGSGVIAGLRRGVQPAPGAFSIFDIPVSLHYDSEAVEDGIAVLCISGPLEHHESGIWQSYEALTREVTRALGDSEVRALVLKMDSPGGLAAGMGEAHKAIRRIRKSSGKPIYAYVDEMACSAAYHLASACDEIWLPAAGQVGSVGVILCTVDETKRLEKEGTAVRYVVTGARKADFHPGQPVSDDVLEVAQTKVDYLGGLFFNAVAKARGMSPDSVEGLQAAVFHGKDAVVAGLADGVAGWSKFLRMVRSSVGTLAGATGSDENGKVRLKAGKSSPATEAKMAVQKKLLSLTKARDEAQAAVASAKTPDERKALLAKFEASAVALALFQASEASTQSKAKAKKMAEEEKDMEEEEEESDDEDCDEEEEEEESDDESDKDSEDDDKDEKSESDMDTEEEKAMSKAFFSAKTGLYTPRRLVRLCQQVTGVKDIREVFGALDGMGIRVKAAAKTEARLARLEGENRKGRVEKMLLQAKRDGKVTKAQFDGLRAKGMADPKFLKGFLASLPKIVRTTEDGPALPRVDANGNLTGMPTSVDQEKMMAQATAGMSPADKAKYEASFAETFAKKNPPAPKRY